VAVSGRNRRRLEPLLQLPERIARLTLVLWAGGLWIVGYLVVPTLFAALPDERMLAGALAGSMFSRIGWLGLACAFYLLGYLVVTRGSVVLRCAAFWVVGFMLLLTLAGHFGVQPMMSALKAQVSPGDVMQSPLRDQFALWHGVSSVLYLLQSLLGAGLILSRRWSPF
jgi:hypothetical protein